MSVDPMVDEDERIYNLSETGDPFAIALLRASSGRAITDKGEEEPNGRS